MVGRSSEGDGERMIIDTHGHFTQIPTELDAYRGRQIMTLSRDRGRGGSATAG